MNAYLNSVGENYLRFSGRTGRREFWTFTLLNALAVVALYAMVMAALLPWLLLGRAAPDALPTVFWGLLLLALGYGVGMLLPTLGMTVRRLHDAGSSGWAVFVAVLPLIGGFILLWLLTRPSVPGSNRWGPDSQGADASSPV